MLIDSHCHLDFNDYAVDLPQVLQRAKDSGVAIMQSICTRMQDAPKIINLCAHNQNIYCSIGVHPCNVIPEQLVLLSELLAFTNHEKVIALGETGLDYYHDNVSPELRLAQQANFALHIEAAQHSELPIIIHTRSAEEDTIKMLQAAAQNKIEGVMHCFTGSAELATAALDLGLYISASGIITFKNAVDLRDIFAKVPLERLLIETDSPYLAPVPHRGKRNEPAFVTHVAECLAEIKGVTLSEIAKNTNDNFFRLFKRCPRPDGV